MLIYYTCFIISIWLVWIWTALGKEKVHSFSTGGSRSLRFEKGSSNRGKTGNLFLVASGLVLICLSGFREGVGTDFYRIYVTQFNNIRLGELPDWEYPFTLLVKAIQGINSDYHLIFFVASLLTIGLVYRAIIRQSVAPTFSVFILCFGGFFFFSLNGVRQAIAVAIFLNAFEFLKTREMSRYIIGVMAAALFHSSAIFLLILYPVVHLSRKRWVFVTVISALAFALAVFSIGMLLPYLPIKYANKFLLGAETYSGDYDLQDLILCFMPVAIFCFSAFSNKEKIEISTKDKAYLVCSVFGVVCSVLSGSLFILYRLSVYFAALLMLFLPYSVQRIQDKGFRMLIGILAIVFLIALCQYLFGVNNQSSVIPYHIMSL